MEDTIRELMNCLGKKGRDKRISAIEEYIGCNIKEAAELDIFYQLPIEQIIEILQSSEYISEETAQKVVAKTSEIKGEESLYLLTALRTNHFSLKACIDIVSQIKGCPIFKTMVRAKKTEDNLAVIDYPGIIKEKDKEIEDLKKEIVVLKKSVEDAKKEAIAAAEEFPPVTEKPAEFTSDVFKAAETGDILSFQYHIEQLKVDPNSTKDKHGSLLGIASEKGNLKIVRYLIFKCHANTEKTVEGIGTPLSLAIREDRPEIVKLLIEHGHANTNLSRPLIFSAVNSGKTSIIKYIVDHGLGSFEDRDKYGYTPLHELALSGTLEMIKYIVENYHPDIESKNRNGCTPLILASSMGYIEVVKYLVEECHANINATDKLGKGADYFAADNEHTDIVDYLISKK